MTSCGVQRSHSDSNLTDIDLKMRTLERQESGYLLIRSPDGIVAGSYESVRSDEMFGPADASQPRGAMGHVPTHPAKVAPITFNGGNVPMTNDVLKSDYLYGSGPNSLEANVQMEHVMRQFGKCKIEPPKPIRTDFEQNIVEEGNVPAARIQKVFATLVDTDFDVMSICDQLLTQGVMRPIIFRLCHGATKAKFGPDWERALKREFLLYLMEEPVPCKALSEAIRASRAKHIEPYLCKI